MEIKELLAKKQAELDAKIKEFNDKGTQMQQVEREHEAILKEILRLDGAVKALKEVEVK